MLTENAQRLLRIEAKLDALIQHLNIEFSPDDAIRKLVKQGDKLGAIKLHRSTYGSDLAEAKRAVESMA